MSGDDLSDSQDLSKSVSLLSDRDTSATETDSIFDSDATKSSVTSRPPPEKIIPDKMLDLEIHVINLSDEGSPVLNNESNMDNEDPSLSQGLDANQIVPKIYISFLGDVADRSSRVQGVDASSNLLFDSNGSPHFPLFWSLEPHKVPQTPLSLLSEEDRAAVEWLKKHKNIDCSALLENEDNPAGLQALLGSMPPKSQTTKTMDEMEMIKALRARERKTKAAEKSGAPSVECLGTGQAQGDGGKTSPQRKKQKVSDGSNPGGANSKPPPSSTTQNATSNALPNPLPGSSEKWWTLFNDFEGASSDVGSIFDRRLPIDQIVEKHFNRKEDRTRVHKAGMKNISKKIQSVGAQMAFFGLCVDQYMGSAEKELKNLLVKNKKLTEKLKNVEGDIKIVERLKADLQASEKKSTDLLAEKNTWDEKFSNLEKKNEDLQKKYDDLLVESKNLGNKVSTLTTEKKDLAAEKESLTAELEDTKAQVAMQHTAGFEKAVSQLQFLYPDLKVDGVGAFKHIVDGKLVNIVVDEDEE
ncbi:hypothetical protein SESBI_48046 [Sesbania bispinosa]|nr:hypothetical protein SESBI_48046 [Sesbania bispinosa]